MRVIRKLLLLLLIRSCFYRFRDIDMIWLWHEKVLCFFILYALSKVEWVLLYTWWSRLLYCLRCLDKMSFSG